MPGKTLQNPQALAHRACIFAASTSMLDVQRLVSCAHMLQEFQRKSQAVAAQLLRGLAIGLGLPEDYFQGVRTQACLLLTLLTASSTS